MTQEGKCCDCGLILPDGFIHRCPDCYDEFYFPGLNDGKWIWDAIKLLIKKITG